MQNEIKKHQSLNLDGQPFELEAGLGLIQFKKKNKKTEKFNLLQHQCNIQTKQKTEHNKTTIEIKSLSQHNRIPDASKRVSGFLSNIIFNSHH